MPLDAGGDVDDDVALLSLAERERFGVRAGLVARRFARAHAGLRRIVAEYQGVAPRAVEMVAPYGRAPRTAVGDLELSLSHSDGVALVAVASTPVGVDLEAVAVADGAGDDLESMAELTLSPRELARFRATATEAQARFWLRSWTRKEAWLKAHDRGISEQALCEVDVSAESVDAHTLIDLAPAGPFVGAIAVAHPRARVVWKELHP
ncbi:MAG TPA: 4'-phosphopantetheinyl transferase superfamily protein [Solirubrobacteraceae bacterium]|nr:4'-phosphopantetheinyl transferase superfamily protein [Solirubrobacteraceae bacterium]